MLFKKYPALSAIFASAELSGRALAKSVIPEDSELMQFFYMADAESWEQEQYEEAARQWDAMDLEEREAVIPDLIEEGYSDHFPHEPATDEEWDEVKGYYQAWYTRNERDNTDTSETFFEKAKVITSPTLVRFQHKPMESDEFRGYGPNNLGLTYHETPGQGDLAFAVDKKDLKKPDDWKSFASKYGKHIYEFKVPYAVKAYHNSDYEWQVVFDVTTVKDLKEVDLDAVTKKKPAKKPGLKKGEKIPF